MPPRFATAVDQAVDETEPKPVGRIEKETK
jgi:hypothetical protein